MNLVISVKRNLKIFIRSLGFKIKTKQNSGDKWVNVTNAIAHNSLDKMNEFYQDDRLLIDYICEERIEFYKAVVELIKSRMDTLDNKKIADIGCGTGHLLYYLQKEFKFQKATGFDYSPEAIKVAKNLFPAFDFYEFDIYQSHEQRFDVLLCTEVLEHLLYPSRAFSNLLSMLKENGVLLITVPNGRTDTFGGHINFWSPESWKVFIDTSNEGHLSETGPIAKTEDNYAIIYKSQKR